MIDLIRQMFATPEAQADAYTWAAVLMGHWAIGAGLAVLLMALLVRPLACAALVSATYGLLGRRPAARRRQCLGRRPRS